MKHDVNVKFVTQFLVFSDECRRYLNSTSYILSPVEHRGNKRRTRIFPPFFSLYGGLYMCVVDLCVG